MSGAKKGIAKYFAALPKQQQQAGSANGDATLKAHRQPKASQRRLSGVKRGASALQQVALEAPWCEKTMMA